jgi:long-chain acyl-CoA synthetase
VAADLLDLSPVERVGLVVPGSEAYVRAVLALLSHGVVPVPLDAWSPAGERDRLLAQVRPSRVVEDQADVEALARRWDGRTLPRARPMHLTSGTTGTPKGVWSGILGDQAARALVAEERDLWGFAPGDVNLVVSPLHHSAPLRFAMGTLLAGGRVVVPGPFDAEALSAVIERDRPTTMFCVPTHLQRLFRHWDRVGAPDLGCFRLVAHAGAPCPPAVKRRLIEAFPPGSTWEFYGSTEGQFTACRGEEWRERPGTVGRARPGRTLSVDADGTIWCAVPEHARFGYFGDPEKTTAAWRDTPAGPAFTVGDLGRLDDDGYLYLDGRREDLVISGGVNVYPVEVEHVLAEHPSVRDVAVFGVPDDEWGQRVCAAVVGDVDAEALRRWARERLGPAKRPKQVLVVDALPHTATGKLRRAELAALVGGPCGR